MKVSAHDQEDGDLANWIVFMDQLHELQGIFFAKIQGQHWLNDHLRNDIKSKAESVCAMASPAMIPCLRSWDFQPPETARPFASSTVGDIIILAHRLGMSWTEIRIGDGVMRAEGHGHSLISTSVRGLGMLFQYTFDRAIIERDQFTFYDRITIPSDEADKFGFRIVPGYKGLDLPDFVFESMDEEKVITDIMAELEIHPNYILKLKEKLRESKQLSDTFTDICDLASLVAPFMPLANSSSSRIHPFPHLCYLGSFSPLNRGWKFPERLSAYLETLSDHSEHLVQVHDLYTYLRDKYHSDTGGPAWDLCTTFPRSDRTLNFIEDLRKTWMWTTSYFQNLQEQYKTADCKFVYKDLVAAYVVQAIHYPAPAKGNEAFLDIIDYYINRLDAMVDDMSQGRYTVDGTKFGERSVIIDAWFTLLLRGMCWNRSVDTFVARKHLGWTGVESSLYGSKIPVYIA